MMIRDYTSNYKIKEFFINEIAPKMFDLNDVNQFTVGLLGYVTEMSSTTTEDAFNAMNIFIKETQASKATMTDTIYTNASYFNIDNIMGTPARVKAFLFIKEEDIIQLGQKKDERYEFIFDSNTEIKIGGVPYALDYDVIISARPFRGDYQYLSQYDMSINSAISKIQHPYLKTHRMKIESDFYIGVEVELGQYKRIIVEENILVDTSLTVPSVNIPYDGQVADIDVYYRKPNSDSYIALEKRMDGNVPSENPFFFYSLKNNNNINITFTSRDRYFQPEYNSDLKIVIYSTLGSEGNFKEYTGTDIQLIINNPKFDYMNQVIPFVSPTGSSIGGVDALDIEDVRRLTVERMSASGAYNTEDNISLYMRNFTDINNLEVTFIRKRDDLIERLFTGFILMKDKVGDHYHTNTLSTTLRMDDFDNYSESLSRYILKPGRLFRYKDDSRSHTEILDKKCTALVHNEFSNEEFLFTNPFLITFQENPNNISYYINTVDDNLSLDFTYADVSSPIQFIVNALSVYRNAVAGEDKYTFTLKMKPTKQIIKDAETGVLESDGLLKVALSFQDKDGTESRGVILTQESYDEEENLFIFKGGITTTDMISSEGRLLITDILNLDNNTFGENMVRMNDLVTNVNIFYDLDRGNNSHPFTQIDDMSKLTLVNKYSTETTRTNLIVPFSFIRSRLKMDYFTTQDDKGNLVKDKFMNVYQIPLLASYHVKDKEQLLDFITEVRTTYYQLRAITKEKTSNYNIDLKFYNTYGRSQNFTVGENSEILDRTNIKMHIKVKPSTGTLIDELFLDIRVHIKDYIENLNKNVSDNIGTRGYNAIYISNLIQELENEFRNMSYMRFVSINDYDSSVQIIENNTIDIEEMTMSERRDYIPEFLTIRLEDIQVDLISR